MPSGEEKVGAARVDRATVVAMEKSMLQVPGVGSVRLVVDEAGEITEIHALIDGRRQPKQVARDFESLLFTRFGIRVDHKKISIAQVGDEPKPVGPVPRLTIRGLELRNQGSSTSVRVELGNTSTATAAAAEGPSSVSNKLRLVASATLAAVKGFLDDGVQFVLEDVRVEQVARSEVIVVCVTLVGAKGEETLLGTCRVSRDETEATIRATLSALNRRLGRLMPHPA
jgi:hypothetical protein